MRRNPIHPRPTTNHNNTDGALVWSGGHTNIAPQGKGVFEWTLRN